MAFQNPEPATSVIVQAPDGSMVEIQTPGTQAEIDLLPATQVGHTVQAAQIYAFVQTPGAVPSLALFSPGLDSLTVGEILLQGDDPDTPGTGPNFILTVGNVAQINAKKLILNLNTGVTDLVSNRLFFLTNSDDYQCTTNISNLGGGEQTLAFSPASAAYSGLRQDAKWEAFLTVDSQLNATSGNVMEGRLYVNGTAQTRKLHHGPAPSTAGDHTMTWSGQLSGGGTSLTFSATVAIAGSGGTGNNITAAQTALHINIYQ